MFLLDTAEDETHCAKERECRVWEEEEVVWLEGIYAYESEWFMLSSGYGDGFQEMSGSKSRMKGDAYLQQQ